MRKERKEIGLGFIQLNEGQLPWLPKNPRQWTQTDVDKTAASIKEDPDFLEDRPLLVVELPGTKDFVAFAGNLRHEGALAAKLSKVPCVLYHPETEEDRATIKRRAMKDNGTFGAWDYDALANEWGDLPLTDWGVPAWDSEPLDLSGMEVDQTAAPGKSDTGFSQISFLFTAADAIVVNGFIEENGKEALVQKIVELCLTAEAK